MKKLLAFVILLLVCTPVVFAEDGVDKLTITNLDVNVAVAGFKDYIIKETYNTKLIFGDSTSTYYFTKNIPLKGTFYYSSKNVDYTAELKKYSIDTDTEYLIDEMDTNNVRFKIGKELSLFNENENFSVNYELLYTAKNLTLKDGIYYVLADSDYDINNVTFNLLLPVNIDSNYVMFSLDGKNFSRDIDGLSFQVTNKYNLVGTYDKVLTAGQKLTVRVEQDFTYPSNSVIFQHNTTNNDKSKELIVYVSLGLALLSISGLVIIIFRRKRRKKS